MLAIACLYLCFTGTMFIENLIMATNHYPLFVAGARIFGGGAFLFALYLLQHKKIVFVQLQQLANVAFFKYVFCLYVLFVSGSAWSMQYMDPVKGCFIFVLSPFMTALMLYFGYQEKLTFKKICGLFVGFFAVVPIILQTNADSATQTAGHLTLIAYGVYAAAVTCGTISIIDKSCFDVWWNYNPINFCSEFCLLFKQYAINEFILVAIIVFLHVDSCWVSSVCLITQTI
jgi:drug/metabolite transporter (DMT)-like permease